MQIGLAPRCSCIIRQTERPACEIHNKDVTHEYYGWTFTRLEVVLLRTPIEARTAYILPLNGSSVSGLLKCSQLFSDGCVAVYVFICFKYSSHNLNSGVYRSQYNPQ